MQEHILSAPMAGQIAKVMDLVATDLVLPSGNTMATEPYEIVQIAREQPIVTSSTYEVDGRPAASLDWSSGERSRVECLEDFNLFAWTTRLPAAKAILLLKAKAARESRFFVATSSHGVVESENKIVDPSYVGSRAQHVCLLRLENPDETFLWEIPGGAEGAKAGVRADFVVMASGATPDRLTALIEETGTTRVVLAEAQIIDLARKLGAL